MNGSESSFQSLSLKPEQRDVHGQLKGSVHGTLFSGEGKWGGVGVWVAAFYYLSSQHLIEQHTVGPPVHRFVVGLIGHNLQRKERKAKRWRVREGVVAIS